MGGTYLGLPIHFNQDDPCREVQKDAQSDLQDYHVSMCTGP